MELNERISPQQLHSIKWDIERLELEYAHTFDALNRAKIEHEEIKQKLQEKWNQMTIPLAKEYEFFKQRN